eukprot:TRINITY_DN6548_c0_g1_i1.p1 TRINITY_DN6548_c0_g1~~TRINITY_DN6548_c0_g1_i1.p1  ORF type:complete len:624 (-),score=147.44 TRINITY_DN6548_c0_g1_i1:22-1893(-)
MFSKLFRKKERKEKSRSFPSESQSREVDVPKERSDSFGNGSEMIMRGSVPVSRPKEFSGVEISPDEIVIKGRIGKDDKGRDKGQQSIIYRGICFGNEVCIKEVKLPEDIGGKRWERQMNNFKQEVRLFSEITHTNVCMFFGASLQPGKCILVTELCSKDLGDVIKDTKNTHLSLFDKLMMAKDICKGMAWLHYCGVVHLDVKPENFLLDVHGTVKVTDFGFSKIYLADKLDLPVITDLSDGGSPLYMPPERLRTPRASPDPSADVYSFAIVFWQLLTRSEPFLVYQQKNEIDPFKDAVILRNERPKIPKEHEKNKVLLDLLESSWNANPKNRPTFIELISQIDQLLIPAAVKDESARQFWDNFWVQTKDRKTGKAATTLRTTVSWKEVTIPLSRTLNIPETVLTDRFPDVKSISTRPLEPNCTEEQLQLANPSQLQIFKNTSENAAHRVLKELFRRQLLLKVKCLKNFLVDDGQVSLVRFGKILDIFGPLDREFLDRIFGFMSEKWFHGDMTKEEAYELLSDKPIGCYLVRFSSTQSSFVISVVVQAKTGGGRSVIHIRVKHTPEEGFSIPNSGPYDDIKTLLKVNEKVFMTAQSPPPSKFDYLTAVPTNASGGYYSAMDEDD